MTDENLGELKMLTIDMNDEHIHVLGHELAKRLLAEHSIAEMIGMLVEATRESLVAVLHSPSPFPEKNVESVRLLLAQLTEHVMFHEKCALEMNDAPTNQKVH